MTRVRLATAADIPAITALVNPIIRDTTVSFSSAPKSEADVAAMLGQAKCFHVAEVDAVVMGYCSYDQFRNGDGYARAMEHSIVIDPDARGRGIGRALIEATAAHAHAADVGSLIAGVSGENTEGIAFHQRCGFVQVAHVPKVGFKFGRWIDLILMQRWLAEDDQAG